MNELKAKIVDLVKEKGKIKVLDVITALSLRDSRTVRDKIRSIFLELANCEFLELSQERGAYVLSLSQKYIKEKEKEEEAKRVLEFERVKKELAKKLDALEIFDILEKIRVYWDCLDALEVYDYFKDVRREVKYLEGKKFSMVLFENKYYILETYLFERIKKYKHEYFELKKLLKVVSKFGGEING